MDYILLGQRIKKERLKCRLTQEQLAEQAHISAVFISEIETGKKAPSLETLFNIAKCLSVSIDSLCVQEDNKSYHLEAKVINALEGHTDKEKQLALDLVQALLTNLKNNKIL